MWVNKLTALKTSQKFSNFSCWTCIINCKINHLHLPQEINSKTRNMASKIIRSSIIQVALMVVVLTTNVSSDDNVPIPGDKSQLNSWYNQNVQPLVQRKNVLDPALVAAESAPSIIKVMQDGSGNFKTIGEAIKSIPKGNTKRVIVYIGGGNYNEKIKIEREKPFITLYGAPGNMPNLTYGGTALQYGTVDSATLIVESDYFVASNLMISVCILT